MFAQPLSDSEHGPYLIGADIELPPGATITPFYFNCPKCGHRLSQELVEPAADERCAESVKGDASEVRASGMASDNAARKAGGGSQQPGLQGVIDPLTHPHEEHAERRESGGGCWKGGEQASAGGKKHSQAGGHEHLVPVVERKFGERIFHWLFGA
ncbi:hypothetical protein RQP53_03630 [Paucibacter sp. APW11]|uniref:Regulatory protein FmdB Zinc ribbon domain-containing protein n=1 Tax=Roseateles aquae TaxID=3077235 RepID=A0ABU3P711_9BURK|nr:hypothetical protein [Paucibacter sp. APW11]MDT8998364.1 hypothetical protein [Paucibacter sp. APW11]